MPIKVLTSEETDLLSASEVANILALPRWKVYRWLRGKQAPPVQRSGRRIFVRKNDLAAVQREQEATPERVTAPEETSHAPTNVPPIDSPPASEPSPARAQDDNASRGCGQRDLIVPRHFGVPRYVFFSGFQFVS